MEKPITFAEYLGMPEAPRDDYVVDDGETHYTNIVYASDYERSVCFEQSHDVMWNSSSRSVDFRWASEWRADFWDLYPGEASERVVGYFV